MPYAADDYVGPDPIPGSIEITQEQFVEAVHGAMSGLLIRVIDGVLRLVPQSQPEPEPEPDPTYQQELAKLNAAYQADVDTFLRAFSLAYLSDGTSQDAKQAAIRTQYYARKTQYTTDLAALKAQYGV